MNHHDNHSSLPGTQCKLVVVQDGLQPCPYLDGVNARMPLRLPVGAVTPAVTDQLLASGYRRSGDFVYRAQCPSCDECKPTRIEVGKFVHTTSMKRVKKRGDRDLVCHLSMPSVDEKRVWLFNEHRRQRGLGLDSGLVDADGYRAFLFDSCCDTRELSILLNGELVAIAILDIGQDSTSAVYTHFDPAASRYSLGTYSILKQIEWATESQRSYVYLGMYVADNDHLNYKARLLPQQRLIKEKWVAFDAAGREVSPVA
ncbi:MAG: arginyltransferase [Rubripirellula sp.]